MGKTIGGYDMTTTAKVCQNFIAGNYVHAVVNGYGPE